MYIDVLVYTDGSHKDLLKADIFNSNRLCLKIDFISTCDELPFRKRVEVTHNSQTIYFIPVEHIRENCIPVAFWKYFATPRALSIDD